MQLPWETGLQRLRTTEREGQLDHLDTQALCTANGISYEPLVFTAQGGIERHAEAVLTQIAAAIAAEEEVSAAQVKAEMLQQISLCLARCAAKAVVRRKPRVCGGAPPGARRCTAEAQLLQHGDDGEENLMDIS